jgi:hypothetical protein
MEKIAQAPSIESGLRFQMDQTAAGTAAPNTCASMYRSRPSIYKQEPCHEIRPHIIHIPYRQIRIQPLDDC